MLFHKLLSHSLKLLTPFILVLFLAGCSEKVVYNRSIADLNQKAQELITQGDISGAVARLESARDLNPDEPSTLFNLGVAYQQKGDLDKSIQTFEQVLALKNAPDKKKINQSLAVVYEEKADELLSKQSEADEKTGKKEETPSPQNVSEAITYYEKAKQTYQALGNQADIEQQITSIDKKIQDVQKQKPTG